jgi:hypothetical protein
LPSWVKGGRNTFVASVISVLITLLAVVASDANDLKEADKVLPVVYVLIALASAVLIGVYAEAFIREFRAERKKLKFATLLTNTTPTFVSFTSREDLLTLRASGDATLEWHFELSVPQDISITNLPIPIYTVIDTESDGGGDYDWGRISLETVEVNGEVQNSGQLSRQELRLAQVQDRPSFQRWVLNVPVDLGEGKGSCSLKIRLTLRGVFTSAGDIETFYVDIPYLTESLIVTVCAPECKVREPIDIGAIHAASASMEAEDAREAVSQSEKCRAVGPALVWKTAAPKMGYRYMLRFRVEGT